MKNTALLAALSLALCCHNTSTAQTSVFADDFEDGNRDGWFLLDADAATLTLESSDTRLGSSNELRFQSESTKLSTFATHFPQVKLASPGDSITLTFDAYNIDGKFINGGLRFGLFNSNGTQLTADGNTDREDVSTDDDGYYTRIDVGNFTKNVAIEIYEHDDHKPARMFGGSLIADYGNDDGPDPLMFSENTKLSYTLKLTLRDDGNLDVFATNNEAGEPGALTGKTQLTPTKTFDTLYIGGEAGKKSEADFRIDNVKLTHHMAEPAAMLLFGPAGLLLWAGRRR